MPRRQRNQGVSLMSLTPMIIGVATALAAVALLAFFVLPSRGESDNNDALDGTSISAPEIAFEDETETATPVRTPKVRRVDDPLIIEPSATWTPDLPTATVIPTETLNNLPGFETTPRVLQPTNVIEETPTFPPVGEVPTAIPTRPPVQPPPPPPPPPTATLQPTISGPTATPQPTSVNPTQTPKPQPTIAPTDVPSTPRPPKTPVPPTPTLPPIDTETPTQVPSPTETTLATVTPTVTIEVSATPTAIATGTEAKVSPTVTVTSTPDLTRTPRGTRTVTATPNGTETVTPEGSPPD